MTTHGEHHEAPDRMPADRDALRESLERGFGEHRLLIVLGAGFVFGVGVLVSAVLIVVNYRNAYEAEARHLAVLAGSLATVANTVAQYDAEYAPLYDADAREATLAQIRKAASQMSWPRQSTEVVVAERVDDRLLFSVSDGVVDATPFQSLPADDPRPQPMKRALQGERGSMSGTDYDGTPVLAGYHPIEELNLGLVIKVDRSEVRLPFVRAALQGVAAAVGLSLLGMAVLWRASRPLVQRFEGRSTELREALDRVDAEQEQRAEAVADLAASEARFRKFFTHSLVGMAITSPEKGWLFVNDALCAMLGRDMNELQARTWAELTHPDDLEADEAQFDAMLSGSIDGYALEKGRRFP